MYILERRTNLQIYKFTNLQDPKIEFRAVTFVILSFCHFLESFNENLRGYIEYLSDTPFVTVCHPFYQSTYFFGKTFIHFFSSFSRVLSAIPMKSKSVCRKFHHQPLIFANFTTFFGCRPIIQLWCVTIILFIRVKMC